MLEVADYEVQVVEQLEYTSVFQRERLTDVKHIYNIRLFYIIDAVFLLLHLDNNILLNDSLNILLFLDLLHLSSFFLLLLDTF